MMPEHDHRGSGTDAEATLTPTDVVMYCRSWCYDCRLAREVIQRCGVPCEEIDVDEVEGAREQAEALNDGRLVTPTFLIDGVTVVNPGPVRLEDLLRAR